MSVQHQLPEGAVLRLTTSSGDVTVIAEDRSDIEAPAEARAESRSGEHAGKRRRDESSERRRHRRGTLKKVIRHLVGEAIYGGKHHRRDHGPTLEIMSGSGGSDDLEVRCPKGTPISIGTISGDIRLHGDFGPATAATASGDIYVDSASAVDARSISGDLEVEACSGHCRLHTKSGHIEVGEAGPAEADTVSGQVRLRKTAGRVAVRTVSGNVELDTDGSEGVKVRTVSGRIKVRVSGDRLPDARLRSLSGRIRCDCPQGSDFPLELSSVSGGIEVEPP